jgi:hypothetical protein
VWKKIIEKDKQLGSNIYNIRGERLLFKIDHPKSTILENLSLQGIATNP